MKLRNNVNTMTSNTAMAIGKFAALLRGSVSTAFVAVAFKFIPFCRGKILGGMFLYGRSDGHRKGVEMLYIKYLNTQTG